MRGGCHLQCGCLWHRIVPFATHSFLVIIMTFKNYIACKIDHEYQIRTGPVWTSHNLIMSSVTRLTSECRNFLSHPRLSPPSTHRPATVTRKGRRSISLRDRVSWGLYKFPPITGFCLFGWYVTLPIALVVGWPCGRGWPDFNWGLIETPYLGRCRQRGNTHLRPVVALSPPMIFPDVQTRSLNTQACLDDILERLN